MSIIASMSLLAYEPCVVTKASHPSHYLETNRHEDVLSRDWQDDAYNGALSHAAPHGDPSPVPFGDGPHQG